MLRSVCVYLHGEYGTDKLFRNVAKYYQGVILGFRRGLHEFFRLRGCYESWPLKMAPVCSPETSVWNTWPCVTTQKTEELINYQALNYTMT
jgi:hypothetical protein